MKKRVLSALLVGVISATALVGCGKSEGAQSNKKLVISTWGLNEDVLKETVFNNIDIPHFI